MAADVLVMEGARASATMILTLLCRDNSVAERYGLIFYDLTFIDWMCKTEFF